MCFNPGDGQVMMLAYVLEEVANFLNGLIVAAGLDRVVPKRTNAVLTLSEYINSLRGPWSMFLEVPKLGRSR